jgi:hypothetical protein
MIRTLGTLFGLAFLVGGLLGFAPGVVKDGMYFGVFMVNPAHNTLHILSGTGFLVATAAGPRWARLWFRIFGALYGALAVIGLVVGQGLIFGLISNNLVDAWGHAGLALAMLAIGFAIPRPLRTAARRLA